MNGWPLSSSDISSSCSSPCCTSPSMAWWLWLLHRINTLLPSPVLHFMIMETLFRLYSPTNRKHSQPIYNSFSNPNYIIIRIQKWFIVLHFFPDRFQRIPVWWRWYYWICPVSWTLYGMITSQFGDVEEMLTDRNVTMVQYLDYFYGFKHDFQGVVAAVVVG